MRRMYKRIIAILLSITLFLSNISIEAIAETVSPDQVLSSEDAFENSTTESEDTEVHAIAEIVKKREANIKHFRMSDGSITAAVYPQDVHYKNENGEFVDINNSLVEENDGTDKVLSNEANEFQVKFMKKSILRQRQDIV